MNLKIFFTFLLLGSLFLESTLVSFPLTFVISLYLITLFKSTRIALIVFLAAFSIDILRVMPIGTTPFIVFICAFAALFYSRAIHFADIFIISIVIFFITIMYSMIAGYSLNIFPAIIVFSSLIIFFYRVYNKKGILTERTIG